MDTSWGCSQHFHPLLCHSTSWTAGILSLQTPQFQQLHHSLTHDTQRVCQGHHCLLLGRPLLWHSHHPPSALCQSLPEHKAVFCLLSTHSLGFFSIQTCKILLWMRKDLQASGSQHNQPPPSSCKSKELTPRCQERNQGQGKHLLPTAHCFSAVQGRVVPQSLRSPCGFPQHDRSCHLSSKVSLPSLDNLETET